MQQSTKQAIRSAKKLYKSCLLCEVNDIRPQIRDKLIKQLSKVNDSEPLAQYRINQLMSKVRAL